VGKRRELYSPSYQEEPVLSCICPHPQDPLTPTSGILSAPKVHIKGNFLQGASLWLERTIPGAGTEVLGAKGTGSREIPRVPESPSVA
jgi:hypothetical protein